MTSVDEVDGELPEGWRMVRLEEVTHRVTDGTHQSPEFTDWGIPFLVIGNLINGQIDWSSVQKWVNEATYEECTARCRPVAGDVLYTAVGSYGIALVVDTEKPFMFQRHIAHIKPNHDLVSAKYLSAALNSPELQRHADSVARGVAQKTVTLGELKEFPLLLPPLPEQRRIVAKLEALQSHSRRAREALEAVSPLLEKLR
jgi:type I restriction enzyme, S subunit